MQNLIRALFVFSIAIELYFFDIIPGLIPITILFDIGIIEFCILALASNIACTADIKDQALMNGIRCFTFALLVLENIYLIVGSRHLYLLRKDIEKEL